MPQFRVIVGQSNAVCIKVIKCPAHRGAGMLKNRNGDKLKCGGHKLPPSLIGIGLFYVVPKSPYVPAALHLNAADPCQILLQTISQIAKHEFERP